MEREEVLAFLLDLAREQGIAVRQQDALRRGERDLLPRSGLCRVRGERWLVILDHDSLEDRIAAAAEGLSSVAGDALEDRYLPPAVRRELGE